MKSLLIILCLFCTILYGQDIVRENFTYQAGMLTIKLKEGWREFLPQNGSVIFGISSLDRLSSEYRLNSLQKRFRYDPAKLRADLPDLSRIYLLTFPPEFDVQTLVNRFSADPHIEYAEPVPLYHTADVPNDPLYSALQHLPQIWAEQAWDIHHGEDGTEPVIVGIVDTSLEWYHPDLVDNVWQNLGEDADGDGHVLEYQGYSWVFDPGDLNGIDDDWNGFTDDLIGWDFCSNDNDIDQDVPEDNHGTHCSGIAAGVTNNETGIASISWNIKVMCTKHSPDGEWLYFPYNGIIYCAENGAAAISNSWGGSIFSQANNEVIEYVTGLGSIVVAAAHNYDEQLEIYPAAYPDVISVAAVAVTDEKTNYSNFGCWIDIAAPGGDTGVDGGILSTISNGSYGTMSGTSMSTPLVTGLLGLIKSYHPDWENPQLITQLLGTADDINDLNHGYENLLGYGRINAYRALAETGVTLPQELKLGLREFSINDANDNGVIEAGELASFDIVLRNNANYVGSDNATFTLVCNDPDITIIDNVCHNSIPPDDYIHLNDVYLIYVSEEADYEHIDFIIQTTADIPLILGSEITMEVPVAPGGIFVWDAREYGFDLSGRFIYDFFDNLGLDAYYSNEIPYSLSGFDAVFLSAGNFGQSLVHSTYPGNDKISIIHSYLGTGGKVFVDGCFFNAIVYNDYPGMSSLYNCFGLAGSSNNYNAHPVTNLQGQPGSLGEGMVFTESNQVNNWYLDLLTPSTSGIAAFQEDNFGIASVQNIHNNGARTFTLSYSLADLVDSSPERSRTELLCRIADHFEMLPEEYLCPYISADIVSGPAPLEVHFLDISVSDQEHPIIAREWDFNSDGIVDSEELAPTWIFTGEQNYDITLTVYTETSSASSTFEDFIRIHFGVLVWESCEGAEDCSGSYIRDYLQSAGQDVTYSNDFHCGLDGFEAVFLSYGNYTSDDHTTMIEYTASEICEYLSNGGCLYLEGGDVLGYDQDDNAELLDLLGLESASDGTFHPVEHLQGQESALTSGMLFLDSDQENISYIDIYTPCISAVAAFFESDYGIVAVQNEGTCGQKSFCFSYTLADLVDGEFPSTRENLLREIAAFFGLELTPAENETVVPVFYLSQNHPNPFNPSTTISFQLPADCETAKMIIYNIKGQKIRSFPINPSVAGHSPSTDKPLNSLTWDGKDEYDHPVASGIYLYKLQADDHSLIRKMILLK